MMMMMAHGIDDDQDVRWRTTKCLMKDRSLRDKNHIMYNMWEARNFPFMRKQLKSSSQRVISLIYFQCHFFS